MNLDAPRHLTPESELRSVSLPRDRDADGASRSLADPACAGSAGPSPQERECELRPGSLTPAGG